MERLPRINSDKEHLSDHYWVLKTIGEGGFSSVKLCWHKLTQTQVAVKIVAKNDPNSSYISNEAKIMRRLCHPNIIRLYHILEDSRNIYYILEHAINGSLRDYIKAKGYLKEEKARQFFYEIICAVQYLHARNISHRDLKPGNILVDGTETLKVCDFGLSAQFKPGQKLTSCCGTIPFTAPEMFYREGYDGKAVDMWSLGIVLYNMLVGTIPFHISNTAQQHMWILLPSYISDEAQDLLSRLLVPDWKERATIHHVLRHPWRNWPHHCYSRVVKSPLRKCTYSQILATMATMGYNPQEIQASLRERKFDHIMATYLILCYHMPQGLGSNSDGQPGWSDKMPCLALSKPPTINVVKKKRPSFYNLHSFDQSPLRCQQQEEDTSQEQGVKHVSLPAIHFQRMRHKVVCHNSPKPESSVEGNVRQSRLDDLCSLSLESSSRSDNQSSSEVLDAQSDGERASTPPPEVRPRRWKAFRANMMRALRALCSCLTGSKKNSRNKVVPGQGTDSITTRNINRPAPINVQLANVELCKLQDNWRAHLSTPSWASSCYMGRGIAVQAPGQLESSPEHPFLGQQLLHGQRNSQVSHVRRSSLVIPLCRLQDNWRAHLSTPSWASSCYMGRGIAVQAPGQLESSPEHPFLGQQLLHGQRNSCASSGQRESSPEHPFLGQQLLHGQMIKPGSDFALEGRTCARLPFWGTYKLPWPDTWGQIEYIRDLFLGAS
ncbi:sperm motility kinase 3A-like [Perognathus longimembris pacificus]|uniref:sperm motility kinase 3A-like n=1 Tax=Perognathus longimembris pacificus TaxID=214514 RepID=UPI00201914A4|nr:sperm motility kinase 3A-like [Perognathus longimembris pacificus]